jgi:4-oxalocrotonate tautomerase
VVRIDALESPSEYGKSVIRSFLYWQSGVQRSIFVFENGPQAPYSPHTPEGLRMPYVNIKITREGATPEKKAALIEGVTRLLQDILCKNPQTTVVVIEEIDADNWGIGGETVTARRGKST